MAKNRNWAYIYKTNYKKTLYIKLINQTQEK